MSSDAQAAALHADALIIDGLVYFSDGDVGPLRAGNVAACNLTISHFEADFAESCEQIAGWHARLAAPDCPWLLIESAADIDRARAAGRVGLIMGWQNMRPIGDNLDRLAFFHRLGLRVMQPTYNFRNFMGDGCLEPDNGGLSGFGVRAVGVMNDLGIAIDLSHVGDRTSLDIAAASAKPLLITHANAKAVAATPRNKSDAVITAVAQSGGTIGVSNHGVLCWNGDAARRPTIDDFLRHLDHIVGLAGIDHVAIGTDLPSVASFDAVRHITEASLKRYPGFIGAYAAAFSNEPQDRYITGCRSHAELVGISAALLERGWSEVEIPSGKLRRMVTPWRLTIPGGSRPSTSSAAASSVRPRPPSDSVILRSVSVFPVSTPSMRTLCASAT